MFDFMQKHRRIVMLMVLIFAGVPMAVFFGVPSPFGGGDPYQNLNDTVIQVYDQPVTAGTFYSQYNGILDRMRAAGQQVPTAEELVKNKTVDELIRGLINDALLTYEVENKGYRPEREYLEEQLKEYAIFKDSQGNFNSGYYNQWVTAQQNAGLDWNEIWDSVAAQVKRDLYVALITASGRVLDSEVKRAYEEENTRVKARYLLIEPPIEPTEDTIREYYEQNKSKYMTDPKVTAVVVPFSIKAEQPAIVSEIIEKARAGEDFAALAQEHSMASSRVNGGSVGWTFESETLPEFRKVLFRIPVGQVGDPVDGPLGIYIYKVEEERTDPDTGVREVMAREIVIPSRLDGEAMARIRAQAAELRQAAEETGSLKAAADAAGLTPIAIGPFDRTTADLTGLDPMDAPRVRMALAEAPIGLSNEPVLATNNLYAAEVTQIDPPREKTLEEARADVARDWEGVYKLTPEYVDKLNALVSQIQGGLADFESLDQILEVFPEITAKVETTRLFAPTDYLFDQGLFIDPTSIHAALGGKEPGALGGPVRDFRNQYYFLQLVERVGPTDEMWENDWPRRRDEMRQAAHAGLGSERMADYLQHQLESATESGNVLIFSDKMFALLGVDPSAPPPPAGDAPVAQPGTELPPAEPELSPSTEAPAPATGADASGAGI